MGRKKPLANEFVRRLQSSIGHLSFIKRTIRHFMSIFELFIIRMRESASIDADKKRSLANLRPSPANFGSARAQCCQITHLLFH